MALEGNQAVLPALPVLTLAAQRAVPVQELKVAVQYRLDLHLPLCGAAGMQEVYHSGQALQGQPWESRGLGLGGHLAAPCSQDQEEVLHRVGGDGEKAILLIIEKKRKRWVNITSQWSGHRRISEEEESRG